MFQFGQGPKLHTERLQHDVLLLPRRGNEERPPESGFKPRHPERRTQTEMLREIG